MQRTKTNQNATGIATRMASLHMLDAILRGGETGEQAMQGAIKGLSGPDRAHAIAITGEVLRWMVDLDALIDGKTPNPLPEDAKARMVLRIALAQMLRLGTPPHAAIATALPLVEKGPRRLVHAVIGALFRDQVTLPQVPTLTPEVSGRWGAAWGNDMVAAASSAFATAPQLDLTLRDASETALWTERLGGVSLAPGHIRLERGTRVEELNGYNDGAWWVQDLAASLPVRLLGAGNDRTALDLCAAPGGKSMQLAAAGWNLTALDNSGRRLERLGQNLARTGLKAELVRADLLHWESETQFDAVILDAPCTSTGTFRRHPDVLHRIWPRHIAEMAELQAKMLDKAAKWVKPGGSLVYVTCSLEREEGEDQATAFLSRHSDFVMQPAAANSLPDSIAPTPQGTIRTLPDMLASQGGLDGFFAAHFVRKV